MDDRQQLDEAIQGEASSSISFGDQVWFWFLQHTRFLARVGIAFVVIACASVAFITWNHIAQRATQRAFNEAITSGKVEDFAQRYGTNKLGGLAFLEVGNQAYEVGNYEKAVDAYGHAKQVLGEDSLGGKAALGKAVSQIHLGKINAAEKLLNKIASTHGYGHFIRGRALALLALGSWSRKDIPQARMYLDRLESGEFGHQWSEQAQILSKEI